MRKILASVFVIGVVGATVIGAARSYFSDVEKSTGNILQAGAIDLEIDNTSYYNGVPGHEGIMTFIPETSWEFGEANKAFFAFRDLKPGDLGEDTISLHLTSNPAWVCVDINLTAHDDGTCTEPELEDDNVCIPGNEDLFDGDLAQQLNFVFWRDDGDNVLEVGEQILTHGPASAILTGGVTWPIADSQTGGRLPLEPGTYYIGKAWCFGQLSENRVSQDEINTSGPNTRGPGVVCDGSGVNNAAQTDLLTGDIVFRAVQARHNPVYVCSRPTPTP